MKNELTKKALAIVAIALMLSLALMRIGGLVEERQARQREAERNVEHSLASRQALLGPVLHRACTEEWDVPSGEDKDRRVQTERREFRLLLAPTRLEVDGSVALEPRHRGLFKVNTYAARTSLRAHWDATAGLAAQREHAGSRLACGSPMLAVATSDVRGIRSAQVRVGGQAQTVLPGSFHGAWPRGFHAVLADEAAAGAPLDAEVQLELAGSTELAIAPVADATEVRLRSDWPHPSFGGRFLPAEREVAAEGFSATWRVSSLASSAPAEFARGAALCTPEGGALANDGVPYTADFAAAALATKPRDCIETLSLAFTDPVNPYVLSDRAVKYGLLFIALTFMALVIAELVLAVRVHPVQYALVGAALTLFFLLLLSLSEHLPFAAAYGAASAACAALLGHYGTHALGGRRAGAGFGAGIAALYAVLYGLLQLEQAALAMGSLLLFALLAALMLATRRLDWYRLLEAPARSAAHGA